MLMVQNACATPHGRDARATFRSRRRESPSLGNPGEGRGRARQQPMNVMRRFAAPCGALQRHAALCSARRANVQNEPNPRRPWSS